MVVSLLNGRSSSFLLISLLLPPPVRAFVAWIGDVTLEREHLLSATTSIIVGFFVQ